MAVGTKDLAQPSCASSTTSDLVDELREAKEELFNLRFQAATGQLENHGRLRAVRKDIARIYTDDARARARHRPRAGEVTA